MTYSTDIRQAGNLYTVTLIGSGGLTVDVGTVPSIAAARRLARIVENSGEMRLQVFFEGKPEQATREMLKANGFKWAPSQKAWQRMRGIRVLDIAKAIVI